MKLRLILISISAILTLSCSSSAQQIRKTLEGKFVAKQSKQLTIDLKQVADSLLGNHCFVSLHGDRIDCCEEAEGYSIKLKSIGDGTFEGILTDCYNGDIHRVRITQYNHDFILIFTDHSHPFAPDTLTFVPLQKPSSHAQRKG